MCDSINGGHEIYEFISRAFSSMSLNENGAYMLSAITLANHSGCIARMFVTIIQSVMTDARMVSTHLQTWRRYRRVPWTAADLLWAWKIRRSSFVSAVSRKRRSSMRRFILPMMPMMFSFLGSCGSKQEKRSVRWQVLRCYEGYAGKFVDLLL